MANPRKFSEKIAMHNQKQAEETARFEQIMREVSDATNKVNTLGRQHLRINQTLGSFRGGSLPNVNHVANNTIENKTDLPNPVSNSEELNKNGRPDSQSVHRDRGRSEGVGPMRPKTGDKRIVTSPYGCGSFLSPPSVSDWRRTNSDSALHQSTQEIAPRRQHHDPIFGNSFNDKSTESRPRSYYEDSIVPGISIHPSHNDPGSLQIPIGNNTGSLPDLTSFPRQSPLSTPLDQEESGPFSTSPQDTRSSTMSPTSLSSRSRHMGRFSFGCNSLQESRVPSPHSNIHSQVPNQPIPSPSQRQGFYQGLTIAPLSPGGPHSSSQTSPLQNHLAVPSVYSSYLHQSKGVTQDNSNSVTIDNYSSQDFIYPNSPIGSPHVNCSLPSQQDISQQPQINSLTSYRNPQPNRPSPQSSPGLTVQPYRSTSPGDSHNSAPQSPASPAGSPAANPFPETNFLLGAQAAALQQHFEQFNMIDTPTSRGIYITTPSSATTQVMSPEDSLAQELGNDAGYYSTSPSQIPYRSAGGGSTQQTTPQTPNTPSSIPDVIISDFSSSATDDSTKPAFVKDLGSAMPVSFDSDLFASDEILREGLGEIDLDGFELLADPGREVISDPGAEDRFSSNVEPAEDAVRHSCRRDLDRPRRNIRHPARNKAHFGSEADAMSNQFGVDGTRRLHGHSQITLTSGAKRGEFISQNPKYLLDDTSSYRQAIKSLQQMLKGIQSGSFNNVYNKEKNAPEGVQMKNWSWKRFGRSFRNGKGYLDYTNSQMPFNEGTKRSPKEKMGNKEETETPKETSSNYSRVRRFLEEERIIKGIKGCTTLEAKEAAMSRVLDPNLNLDGILEPHVRKRRRRSLREDVPRQHT